MNVSQLERNEIPCKVGHLSTFLCMRNNCTHKETVLSLNNGHSNCQDTSAINYLI